MSLREIGVGKQRRGKGPRGKRDLKKIRRERENMVAQKRAARKEER